MEMDNFSFYTFGHATYFETLSRLDADDKFLTILRCGLPADWRIDRFDIWLQATPPNLFMPRQGFKIHVSATADAAEQVLSAVLGQCVDHGVTFKVVADQLLLRFVNSKRYYRGGSGKFITIYPSDERVFLDLSTSLQSATSGLPGPYILSDRRVNDVGIVYYRYGGFQRITELNADGTRSLMIEAPNGQLLLDDRTPYFALPSWVQDPLHATVADADQQAPLNQRYEVVEAMAFTNTGGVYKAKDMRTGGLVVLKEARPHTETWIGTALTVEAPEALRHERDVLERLAGLSCVPTIVDWFQEWEHTFMVTSLVAGISLAELRASSDFLILEDMMDSAQMTRFSRGWRSVALGMLDALKLVHARGVIVGDISPTNVFFDTARQTVTLIDFEGAVMTGTHGKFTEFASHWFNPGFRRPDRRNSATIEFFDDAYSLGMLLYNLVCPVQSLFELDVNHPVDRFLDYFDQEGLPRPVSAVIRLLLQGRLDAAYEEMAPWQP